MSRCFLSLNPSSTFANFATFLDDNPPHPPTPLVRFISGLHSVGMQLLRSRPRPLLVPETVHMPTHTHSICSHTLNQGDTSTCFCTPCINALSCTSSSTAFVVVLLLHHPDCTWTQHSAFLPCVGVLKHWKPPLMSHIKSWCSSTYKPCFAYLCVP